MLIILNVTRYRFVLILAWLIHFNVTSYRFVLILAWLIHIFMNIQAIKSYALIIYYLLVGVSATKKISAEKIPGSGLTLQS